MRLDILLMARTESLHEGTLNIHSLEEEYDHSRCEPSPRASQAELITLRSWRTPSTISATLAPP